MMKLILISIELFLMSILCSSLVTKVPKDNKFQSSTDYYQNINSSAVNDDLKYQLKALINPHIVYSYDEVWTAFETVDKNLPTYPCNGNLSHIPDVYSSFCWSPEKIALGGECGNYKQEGDCYNREHLWPKSWFGGFDYGMNAQTDLFELWPSDGYVNGLRGNYPLGNVSPDYPIKYTSSNGCRIGTCASLDYKGTCFEPANIYKGDFARSYFYLSTAYANEWSCCDDVGVNGSYIKPWMETELRAWHELDPVDSFELNRNEIIYSLWQLNRNPYIDNPQWVSQINDF